ncbi:glycosyltransferase family 39 protein [Facilibium subflavum]|uniref:glycosyltransferase family 39 protein n=1 Tax=Facilibium subflavum TaxID=2219058 RepID=UPI000E65952A|nr:glycosyltransferase family 39 protein [Facilibium subflavum]
MIQLKKPGQLFWLFFIIYALLWTLVPSLVRFITPMDATEGAMWAHTLQWGYPRDPWLNALLTKIALFISNNHDWGIYLFSQLMVVLAVWSVWRLGRIILDNDYLAFVSVVILVGVQYYNLAVIDFNDNACLLGLWPAMALYFYRSLTTNRLKHWLLLGIISGLAMMAKYYTAIPLVCMLLFVLFYRDNRRFLRNYKLYCALLILIVISLPHAIWLVNNNYLTINYSFGKLDHGSSFWLYARGYALHFFLAQIGTFMGAVALFLFGLFGKAPPDKRLNDKVKISSFSTWFLFYVGLGPFLFTVILSILVGWDVHTMWGIPLLSLWGIILIALVKPVLTYAKFYRIVIAAAFVTCLLLVGYTISLSKSTTSSANYPAREIAEIVTKQWHARYHRPLQYVAGYNKPVSYIARYSLDKPQALIAFNPDLNPALDIDRMKAYGAVFILIPQMEGTRFFPKWVLQKYPRLEITPYQEVAWKRAKPNQAPMRFQVAFLPPTRE